MSIFFQFSDLHHPQLMKRKHSPRIKAMKGIATVNWLFFLKIYKAFCITSELTTTRKILQTEQACFGPKIG